MSGVADDGAARLDQVMRKHQVGPKSAMARNPSQSSRRASREVESQADQQPGSSSPDRPQPTSDQENTAQATNRFEALDSTSMEAALREKAYRLAGAWEQGATKLSAHLPDALADLQSVKQHENDLLQRRVDLCCGELDDQIAVLEREFQQKAEACKQEMLARIADQRAACELAIRVKTELLISMLEDVDGVPCASQGHGQSAAAQTNTDGMHRHKGDGVHYRLAQHPDQSLAHAPCHCCSQDKRIQQLSAQPPELYPAHRPIHRRLEYTSLSPSKHIEPPQCSTYAGSSKPANEWWKPSAATMSPDRKGILEFAITHPEVSPAAERMATLGVTFRRYKPCNCRARSGMVAPRAPLRLSHLLDHSDEE